MFFTSYRNHVIEIERTEFSAGDNREYEYSILNKEGNLIRKNRIQEPGLLNASFTVKEKIDKILAVKKSIRAPASAV